MQLVSTCPSVIRVVVDPGYPSIDCWSMEGAEGTPLSVAIAMGTMIGLVGMWFGQNGAISMTVLCSTHTFCGHPPISGKA